MASKYSTNFDDYECVLEMKEIGNACKLIIRKERQTKCEIEFDSISDFMTLTDELQSLSEKWRAEVEYDLGLREFYFEG